MQEDIKAHINTFCMGFLSEEHLIALLIFVQAPLQLNLTECKSCKNSFIVDVLKKRLELVETKISPHPIPLPNGERGRVRGKIMLIEDKSDLQYQAIPYDRRGFFSALKKLTMKGAASFLDSAVDQKQMSAYGDKVLPFKRKLLNRVLSVMIENNTKDKESVIARSVSPHLSLRGSQSEPKQSQSEIPRFARNDKEKAARNDKEKGLSNKILANYYFDLVVDDNCDMCFACIGMCPTGALKEPHVSDDEHESINKEHTPLNPPLVRGELKGGMLFNASFCNGCGLCSDFCVQSSISIKHGFSGETPFEEKCVKKENG
ncbi:MAG: hypothetical protein Q8N09_08275 [Thermodesulfovibrionia bacterium]|nr:hypothetical protein [Thermodesulfovibrionia bacterium]